MRRPVILLPPSRGKAPGGSGRPYAHTLVRHPLADHRREVLDAAIACGSEPDDAVLARRCGVAERDAAAARRALRDLADAPTMPAHRRYTGVVHGNAGLAAIDPRDAGADVRIVSALMGLVALDEPVPSYRLEFTATLPGLTSRASGAASGSIATFWRDRLDEELCRVAGGARVWDLLPGEHARMWPAGVRDDLDVITVRFVRPDGRPANAARTKVAKGRLTAFLLARPGTTPSGLVRADRDEVLGPGWSIDADGKDVAATFAG